VSTPFREAADQLLVLTTEQLDPAVTEAARELRDVCAEYDEVSDRFEAAGQKLMRLLKGASAAATVCAACGRPQAECATGCPARRAGGWER
jgi:hypothetical protein